MNHVFRHSFAVFIGFWVWLCYCCFFTFVFRTTRPELFLKQFQQHHTVLDVGCDIKKALPFGDARRVVLLGGGALVVRGQRGRAGRSGHGQVSVVARTVFVVEERAGVLGRPLLADPDQVLHTTLEVPSSASQAKDYTDELSE